MASDSEEIVRSAFDALAERGVEGMLEFVDERAEMTTPPEISAEPDVYVGHDGLRRYFDSFYEVMESVTVEVLDVESVGSEQAVASLRLVARGRVTGIESGQDAAMLCTVRAGRMFRTTFFRTRAEALAAASC